MTLAILILSIIVLNILPGFVWRLKDEMTEEVKALFGDSVLFTLSIWKSVDALRTFLFKTPHIEYMKRGNEWFEKLRKPKTVLWWIDNGHQPTLTEAKEKLDLLTKNGPTAEVFGLSKLK